MFVARATDGRNNIVGHKIAKLRKARKISQRILAEEFNEIGWEIDKNGIQRIESGQRFVTDIELRYISKLFGVSIPDLYKA